MELDTDTELIDPRRPRKKLPGFSRLDRGRIPDDVNVVWKPHFGSQSLALASPAKETLYHGPRGGGKTDAQIMRFRRNVGVGYGAFWRGVIFDVEYKNLDDIVAKSLKWFPQFNDGAVFLRSAKDYKWVWPTGEELLFRTGSTLADYNQFHGHEYCLANGERVRTDLGLVEIERLNPGDMVMTPVGYRRVNAVYFVGRKECVDVSIIGTAKSQRQSVNHRLLCKDGLWRNDTDTAMCLDERGCSFSFYHPYNGTSISSLAAMSSCKVGIIACGWYDCWDIEVDEVNCYITESGLVNKNCFIGFNELTKQPSADFFDAIKSCNRSSFVPEVNSPDPLNPLPPIPLEIFCTTNPHGIGHSWVKRYFIDAGEPGEIITKEIKILSPSTRRVETVKVTKTHVFGHWIENGKLPDSYIADLVQITDENKRKAWAHGDWNVTAGGALDDVWDHRYVRKPRFKVPPQWKKDRTFDWGSTVPFYTAWWAEADGSEVEIPWGNDGKTIWWGPPKGSLIMFNEWYGSTSWTSNVGLRIGPKAVAEGIAARERSMREKNWIVGEVKPGPADNQIHNQNDADTDSIAKRMALPPACVRWTESDKSPGSRKNGLALMRDMLHAAVTGDGPGIFFMDNCQAALNILPMLQRDLKDPDDAASDGQDHPWDAVRYRILDKKPIYAKSLDLNFYGGQR